MLACPNFGIARKDDVNQVDEQDEGLHTLGVEGHHLHFRLLPVEHVLSDQWLEVLRDVLVVWVGKEEAEEGEEGQQEKERDEGFVTGDLGWGRLIVQVGN